MLKFKDRINRYRHNKGYGIQSPSSFFFVTQVLKERYPYYAYLELDSIAKACHEMSDKQCRLLFRIANYLKPTHCITVESVTAACAIGCARRSATQHLITGETHLPGEAQTLLADCRCKHQSGDTGLLLNQTLKEANMCGMLYIGKSDKQAQILHTALEYTNKESIIIVEGIHADKQSRELWQKAISNPKSIITYDMYNLGILLFNDERVKQNYTLKI